MIAVEPTLAPRLSYFLQPSRLLFMIGNGDAPIAPAATAGPCCPTLYDFTDELIPLAPRLVLIAENG